MLHCIGDQENASRKNKKDGICFISQLSRFKSLITSSFVKNVGKWI